MIDWLKELFDGLTTLSDKVTFGMALVGFFATLVSGLRTWWRGRMRLEVVLEPLDHCSVAFRGRQFSYLTIAVLLSNKSSCKISVYSVSLFGAGEYMCRLRPGFVGTDRNNIPTMDGDPVYLRYIESIDFPINLNGLQSTRGYVMFTLPHEYDFSAIREFWVNTSSGRLVIDDHEQIAQARALFEEAAQARPAVDATTRGSRADRL